MSPVTEDVVRVAIALVLIFSISCAARRAPTSFRVLPAKPDYLLRSPDATDVPFPEVLSRYTNIGPGWVELRPQTDLRVENAYFREGAPKRGLANFLGTEIARYRVLSTGALEEVSVESRLTRRPSDQPAVQQLLSERQRRYRSHRLFYQVLLSKKSNVRSAVLLGAEATDELERLTAQLMNDPESVCDGASTHCTGFPEACTASLEMEIVVNDRPRAVIWGSTLTDVAEGHRHVELFRSYMGQFAPVAIDPLDREALRLPLVPGDHVKWR